MAVHNKSKFIFIILIILLSCCTQRTTTTGATEIIKGVSVSPRIYNGTGFHEFLDLRREVGALVGWYGDWNELSINTSAPFVIEALKHRYDYEPIIIVTPFYQPTGSLIRPLNMTITQEYINSARSFAQTYTPEYFGIGIEINVLYERNPSAYEEFVKLFNDTYDAVKLASSNTKIFPVFQLERMKGLSGGLFGGASNESDNEWFLLDDFIKADLAVFTTYPCLIYNDPKDVPEDYYSVILNHTNKMIGFSEIGWFSSPEIPGWASSEEEQTEFINRFFNLTKSLNAEFSIWSFLYDQNVQVPFDTMGLYYSNGSQKLAWNAWKQ